MNAKNGKSCDCETPGDWHRVANNFQKAMFDERICAATAEAALDEALDILYQMQHSANWTFSPKSRLAERAEDFLREHGRLRQ